jgi:hypothetical protein
VDEVLPLWREISSSLSSRSTPKDSDDLPFEIQKRIATVQIHAKNLFNHKQSILGRIVNNLDDSDIKSEHLLTKATQVNVDVSEYGSLLTKSIYINDLLLEPQLLSRMLIENNALPTPSMDYSWWSGAYELDSVKAAQAAKSSLATPITNEDVSIDFIFHEDVS